MSENIATRQAYGKALVEFGKIYPNIVVLDADVSKSTYTALFAKEFSERFFNVGVAEANLVGVAAGLATAGKIPFASTFSIFATGRAWDQLRNTVAYSKLNVRLVGTHGGISVGADGASHQAIEDFALTRSIPEMTVIVPCDGVETRKAIEASITYEGPIYMRMGRSKVPVITGEDTNFEIGRGVVLKDGADVAIFACGAMVANALDACELLKEKGIDAAVIDMHTLKPLDEEIVVEYAEKTGALVSAEEHVLDGGLGSAICQVAGEQYPVPVEMIGIRNRFGQSGEADELFIEYKLTAKDIAEAAGKAVERKR